MAKEIVEVDNYIKKSADFAKPILIHFRNLVHETCPEVEEKIKWGMPFFDYKGKMMCNMSAFKQHCAIGFYKAALLDDALVKKAKTEEAMGQFGRITSLKDLPSDKILIKWIHAAMELNDKDIKPAKKPAKKTAPIEVPDYVTKAINKKAKAKQTWEKFSNGHRKEYVTWITEAKTEATRNKRIATMMEWLVDGKSRNWKYQ